MVNRVGTSSGSLSESTGGVTDELGNALLSTDVTGAEAQTLGPQLVREIAAGVPNADFALPSESLEEPISNDNDLPFYTLNPGDAWGLLAPEHITASVVDTVEGAPSGFAVRFTVEAGAAENEALVLDRWVPVASNYHNTLVARPYVGVFCENPGGSANDCYVFVEASYYAADRNTLIDTANIMEPFVYFADPDARGAYGLELDPFFNQSSVPLGAAWILLRVGVRVFGVANTTDTEELTITGLRVARGTSTIDLPDSRPVAVGAGAQITMESSTLALVAERGVNGGIDPWSASPLRPMLQIAPTPSVPSENSYLSLQGISPEGAKYVHSATAVAPNTTVQLGLGTAVDEGSGNANAPAAGVVNEPGSGGVYLINARASFESDGTGTYRRLFLYANGSSIANTILTVDASASYTVTVTTVQSFPDNSSPIGSGGLELYARHDATGTLDVTPVELSIIRLGGSW